MPALQQAGKPEERHGAGDDSAGELRDDDQHPSRHSIRDGAAEQQKDETGGCVDGCERTELECRSAELNYLERIRDLRDERAEERKGLSGPQETEVTMSQRLEDAGQFHTRVSSSMTCGSGARSLMTRVGDVSNFSPWRSTNTVT